MRGPAKGKLPFVKGLLPAAALGLGLAALGAPQAAHAQFWSGWSEGWGGGGGLDRQSVRQSIGQQGFRVIAPMRRNGAVFVADVLDPQGQRERLIVAAADGQILQRFYLDDPRLPGRVPHSARAMPSDPNEAPVDGADRADLVPPADIPNAGGRGYADPSYQAPNQAPDGRILGRGSDEDVIQPLRPRPPIKAKPKPRIVERTPDTVRPDTPIIRKPLDAPQTPDGAPARGKPDAPVASAPAPTTASTPPSPPPAPPSTTTRLRDPLAIPDGEPKPAGEPGDTAARVVPGVTGGPVHTVPAEKPKPAPQPSDVPAAPLD